jgi:hypothetical protein
LIFWAAHFPTSQEANNAARVASMNLARGLLSFLDSRRSIVTREMPLKGPRLPYQCTNPNESFWLIHFP